MGRAPCCEKLGLKKGPWTPEEDHLLISYIQKNGHGNWRALPKQAGLLRCGKSCRLRWINYLRPDIRRGNFTQEEENTIIQMHETLGNRWSAIASKLPGRTDNEIKNVWHTHLKKQLQQKHGNPKDHQRSRTPKRDRNAIAKRSKSTKKSNDHHDPASEVLAEPPPLSPPQESFSADDHASSVISSPITEKMATSMVISENTQSYSEDFPLIDEDLWLDPELVDNSSMSPVSLGEIQSQLQFASADFQESGDYPPGYGPNVDDDMDFWYHLFVTAGGMEETL